MPTVSKFYGIKITMNYNEHNPPHFHAEYQDHEVIAVQGPSEEKCIGEPSN